MQSTDIVTLSSSFFNSMPIGLPTINSAFSKFGFEYSTIFKLSSIKLVILPDTFVIGNVPLVNLLSNFYNSNFCSIFLIESKYIPSVRG